jgi:hypothetical protein
LKAAPLARLGYHQYTHINQIWDMKMPIMADDTVSGGVLAGNIDGATAIPSRNKPDDEKKAVDEAAA